jgi:hypothetical protein
LSTAPAPDPDLDPGSDTAAADAPAIPIREAATAAPRTTFLIDFFKVFPFVVRPRGGRST